jgi:hypothetical protein
MDTNLVDVVRELMDYLEDSHVCDEHHLNWLTDEDCFIESDRSPELQELINKVNEALEDV